jgi:hypothetical protein
VIFRQGQLTIALSEASNVVASKGRKDEEQMRIEKTIMTAAAMLVALSAAAHASCANPKDRQEQHRCEHLTACHVTITHPELNYFHRGDDFEATGGSTDPNVICQHGGGCIPLTSVKFNHPCKRTCSAYNYCGSEKVGK